MIGPFWCEKSQYWLRFRVENNKFIPEVAIRVPGTKATTNWEALTPEPKGNYWTISYQLTADIEASKTVLTDALNLDSSGSLYRARYSDKPIVVSRYGPQCNLFKANNQITHKKCRFLTMNPDNQIKLTAFDELPLTPEQALVQQLAQQEQKRLQKEKWNTWRQTKGLNSLQFDAIAPFIVSDELGFLVEAKRINLLALIKDAIHGFLKPEDSDTEEHYLNLLNLVFSDPNNKIHEQINNLAARTDIERDPQLALPFDSKKCNELKKKIIYALFQAERASLIQFFGIDVVPITSTAADEEEEDDPEELARAFKLSMEGQTANTEPVDEDDEETARALLLSMQDQQTQTATATATATATTTATNIAGDENITLSFIELARILARNPNALNVPIPNTQGTMTQTQIIDPSDEIDPDNAQLADIMALSLLEQQGQTQVTQTQRPPFPRTNPATTAVTTQVAPAPVIDEEPKAVALRHAVIVAVAKYLAHHMGQQKHRGAATPFNSVKHSKKGRDKALELKTFFESKPTEEEGQNEINSFICHPDTRFGRHSLVSFVLDELTKDPELTWTGIAPNSKTNCYNREQVIVHVMTHSPVPEPTKDKQTPSQQAKTQYPALKIHTNMMVLGGFITALGVAAVALALILLNAATLGLAGVLIIFGVGLAGTLGGIGIFASSQSKKKQLEHAIAADSSDEFSNSALIASA